MFASLPKSLAAFLLASIVFFAPASFGRAIADEAGSAVPTTVDALQVHFVDVGQGDACIIRLPDERTILIDGGENAKEVEKSLQTFIDKTLGEDFTAFDYAILTHPDSDHCGSMDYILNAYPARICYRPNVEAVGTDKNPYTDPGKADLSPDAVTKNTAVYANAVKAMYTPAAAHDFTPEVRVTDARDDSQTITGGEGEAAYSLTFYTPLSAKYTGEGDWNNYSPVMLLQYRGYRFMMSGDAEEKNLAEFVAKVKNAPTDNVEDKYDLFDDKFTTDVLKLGHHGSGNAITSEYFEAVTTEAGAQNLIAVISCGEGNKYGHPHEKALQILKDHRVPDENIKRTDRSGDITVSVQATTAGGETTYALKVGDAVRPDTPVDETESPKESKEGFLGLPLTRTQFILLVIAVVVVLILVACIYVYMRKHGIKADARGRSRGRRRGGR